LPLPKKYTCLLALDAFFVAPFTTGLPDFRVAFLAIAFAI
jgi:hypothetical protein